MLLRLRFLLAAPSSLETVGTPLPGPALPASGSLQVTALAEEPGGAFDPLLMAGSDNTRGLGRHLAS